MLKYTLTTCLCCIFCCCSALAKPTKEETVEYISAYLEVYGGNEYAVAISNGAGGEAQIIYFLKYEVEWERPDTLKIEHVQVTDTYGTRDITRVKYSVTASGVNQDSIIAASGQPGFGWNNDYVGPIVKFECERDSYCTRGEFFGEPEYASFGFVFSSEEHAQAFSKAFMHWVGKRDTTDREPDPTLVFE